MEPFRERLKRAAEHAGVEYGQTAIARSLQVNKQTVDRWMGSGEPKPAQIYRIAERWRVDPKWLATGEGAMTQQGLEPVAKGDTHDKIFIPAALFESLLVAIRSFLDTDREGQEEILEAVRGIGRRGKVATKTVSPRGRRRRP
jgi:hypothetical protein